MKIAVIGSGILVYIAEALDRHRQVTVFEKMIMLDMPPGP